MPFTKQNSVQTNALIRGFSETTLVDVASIQIHRTQKSQPPIRYHVSTRTAFSQEMVSCIREHPIFYVSFKTFLTITSHQITV